MIIILDKNIYNLDLITSVWHDETDINCKRGLNYIFSNEHYWADNVTKKQYLKLLKYLEKNGVVNIDKTDDKIIEVENDDLRNKIEKLQKDFKNILTLTGSIDTQTIINLEERLKLLESKLNKD